MADCSKAGSSGNCVAQGHIPPTSPKPGRVLRRAARLVLLAIELVSVTLTRFAARLNMKGEILLRIWEDSTHLVECWRGSSMVQIQRWVLPLPWSRNICSGFALIERVALTKQRLYERRFENALRPSIFIYTLIWRIFVTVTVRECDLSNA